MASNRSVAGVTSGIHWYQILKLCFLQNTQTYLSVPGPGCVIGIAIHHGLKGSGFCFRWGKNYSLLHTRLDRPWGPPSLLYNGYRGNSPGINYGGMTLTTNHQPPLCLHSLLRGDLNLPSKHSWKRSLLCSLRTRLI